MSRLLLSIPLLIGLFGCGETRSNDPDASEQPAAGPSAEGPTAEPLEPVPEPADRPGGSVALALEGEGLRVFNVSSGTARPVPFGTPSVDALRILESVQGAPPRERGESPDCGGAFATWEGGLTVRFSGDRFVGWSVREPGLTTASGVGVGSTRDELEGVYAARVARTSLGVEFSAGDLAGVLDSADGDARVVALWAGATCLAR